MHARVRDEFFIFFLTREGLFGFELFNINNLWLSFFLEGIYKCGSGCFLKCLFSCKYIKIIYFLILKNYF